MLPTFMHSRHLPKRTEPAPSGRIEKVRLLECPQHLEAFWFQLGVVEGTAGDDVLVRFGDVVVQVPPEWIEGVE